MRAFVPVARQFIDLGANRLHVREIAARDGCDQAVDFARRFLDLFFQGRFSHAILCRRLVPVAQRLANQAGQTLGRQKLVRQRAQYERIQFVLPHGYGPFAGRGSFEPIRGTGVVAVGAAHTLASAHHHRTAAAIAAGKAGQQNFAVRSPGSRHIGTAGVQERLDALEVLGRDDLRHFDRNPFVLGTRPARPAVMGVVVIDTGIGVPRQDGVYDAHIIWIAVPIAESVAIHPGRYVLDAHRPLGAVALEKQSEYLAHGGGFPFLDFQPLLDFLAALFGLDGAIAERRLRTVPKSLPGIFQHGPRDVLGGFLAAVLIRCRQNCLGKIGARSFAEILRHRNDRHAVFFKLAFPERITGNVSEKSRLAVNQNYVNRRGVHTNRFHHALKLRRLSSRALAPASIYSEKRDQPFVAQKRLACAN
ncbi:MAG: hypothetical protein WDN08_07445 [Rhizomicrobium sp.]